MSPPNSYGNNARRELREVAEIREWFKRGIVNAIRGVNGNTPVQRIKDTLAGRTGRDHRPPGICSGCWAAAHRERTVYCGHTQTIARRSRRGWAVLQNVSPRSAAEFVKVGASR